MALAVVQSLLVFCGAVALLTEALSPFYLLRRGPLLLCWGAILVAAIRFRPRPALPARPQLLDALLLGGIGAIALVIGLVAVASPPNSADALAYHLPRVVYWAQSGSVEFFPTHYLNQVMLPPLAEYIMLHTYILSGGDHYVNLVQFLGFLGSLAAVSLVARSLGAGRRGQIIAALFCATLPNGILQASGAKNDYLLAFFLAAMVYFALERRPLWLGLSLGLALLTKATAWLFAPALLAGVFTPSLLRGAPLIAACVLLLNGPQYWRNYVFSGSPFGYDSAHGDGLFRWRNESLGLRPTLSNLLRHLSDQLGARSEAWNQGVYRAVVRAHQWIGADPDDPNTTWRWSRFEPPRNTNHETNAPNRWHLLLLAAAALPLLSLPRLCQTYYAGIVLGFLLFCFYLKWQPFMARLELPLFVAAAPLAGLLAERYFPAPAQALLCLFLLNNARPYLFENWTRPLTGPRSILRTSRDDNYFSDMQQWNNQPAFLRAVELVRQSGCGMVGIDNSIYQVEYPFQALLRQANPVVRFVHTPAAVRPCAVLCLNCAGREDKVALYRDVGPPIAVDRFLLFLP